MYEIPTGLTHRYFKTNTSPKEIFPPPPYCCPPGHKKQTPGIMSDLALSHTSPVHLFI